MNRPLLFLGLCWICLCSTPMLAHADELRVSKQKNILALESKSYVYTGSEVLNLYGVRIKHFITPEYYWGEVGYAAVGGQRSGYIEGGMLVGYFSSFFQQAWIDLSLSAGAAGGGLPQLEGGGFLLQPVLAVGVDWGGFNIGLHGGWEYFVNGSISSATWGLGVEKIFWSLQ